MRLWVVTNRLIVVPLLFIAIEILFMNATGMFMAGAALFFVFGAYAIIEVLHIATLLILVIAAMVLSTNNPFAINVTAAY